jgi:hypothetical protein
MSIWSEDCLKEAFKKFKRNAILNTESLKDFFDVAIDYSFLKNKKYLVSLLEVSKRNKIVHNIFKDNAKLPDFKTIGNFFDKKCNERKTYEKKQEDAFKKKLK